MAKPKAKGKVKVTPPQEEAMQDVDEEEVESSSEEGDSESGDDDADDEDDEIMTEEDITLLEDTLLSPSPAKGAWSAAEVVNANAEGAEGTSAVAEHQRRLANCVAGIQLGVGGADFIDLKALKAEKLEIEKAIAKANKGTPVLKISATQIRLDM